MKRNRRNHKPNPVWHPWGRVAEVPAAAHSAEEDAACALAGQLMWILPDQEWEHEPTVDERRFAYAVAGEHAS